MGTGGHGVHEMAITLHSGGVVGTGGHEFPKDITHAHDTLTPCSSFVPTITHSCASMWLVLVVGACAHNQTPRAPPLLPRRAPPWPQVPRRVS